MSRTAWRAFLALVLCLLTGNAAAAVLGIDFGTDYYKISVISRKKTFDMVENLNSKTNTYNALSFFDGARVLEYEAFTKELKAPTSSFHLFSKLLGRDPQDKLVQEWRATHRDQFKWVQEGNSTFVQKRNIDSVQIDTFQLPEGAASRTHPSLKLRVEELAGMVLQHARGLSDKYAGEEAKDVFFSVPPWWTPVERQVIISAAKLAGFHVLGMSSENTGTAVYHGVNRPKNAKNETILFLNVGTLSTKIGVYRFENVTDDKKRVRDTVRLLGEAWDETTGGLAFDVCIAEDFARSFDDKFKLESVLNNPKVMRRLIREATKTREVLSANKETSMIVEEVFDNKDYIKKYTREDFEKACAPLFERIAKTVETTIKRAGIETKDLNEVELLGGASRMPGVHAIIKEKLGRTHSIHFNGDNSMAQGLAYMAANASNLINGKLVYLTNGPSYDITVQVEDPNTTGENQYKKTSTLFKKYHSYGSKKLVNLNYDKDVKVTLLVQSDESPYQLAKPYSISYQLSGVSTAFQKLNDPKFANKKFSLHFELSSLGFPSLLKAEVVAEETTENKDGKKSVSNHFEKIKVVQLEESHQGLFQFPELMKESASILTAFQEHDRKLHLLKAARNKLESIVYRMADMATDENIKKYSAESEVELLKAKATEIDDWLFTPDARKSTYEELDEKARPFNEFQAVVERRKTEHLKRPQALKEIHEKFDSLERTFRDMVDTRPWVPEADRKAAITKIHQIRAWVEDKSAEQAARSTKLDPILTLADLKEKESEASKEMTRIRAIPNPADKPKKKPEEPKEAKESPKGSETKIPLKPLLESLGLTPDQIAKVNKRFPLDDPNTDLQQVLQYVKEQNMSVKLAGGDKQQGEAQPDL